MNQRIISLNFNKKDFEEIYFRDNQGNLFFCPSNKRMTIISIVFAGALGFLYFFNLISVDNFGFYYFLGFILLICLFKLLVGILEILEWKNGITKYLKSLDKNSVFQLELTDDFLIVSIDYEEDYFQWKEFKKVELKNDYIFLQAGNQNFLFPKKSMSDEDYIFLKDSIQKKLGKQKTQSKSL